MLTTPEAQGLRSWLQNHVSRPLKGYEDMNVSEIRQLAATRRQWRNHYSFLRGRGFSHDDALQNLSKIHGGE